MKNRERTDFIQHIAFAFTVTPAVALLGPRQCGKTTLARMYIEEQKTTQNIHYFDLEKAKGIANYKVNRFDSAETMAKIAHNIFQK